MDNIKERGKEILDKYHNLDLENMVSQRALKTLASVAEEMADIIADFVWDE